VSPRLLAKEQLARIAGGMMPRFETILCPIHPAAPSEVALQHALAFGDWFDARVTILDVRPHGRRVGRVPGAGQTASPSATRASALEERIQQASAHSVRVQVVQGAVGREIIRAADVLRADLIVMGARQVGRVERLLLRSVVEHVLTHTSCPVLILSPEAGSPPSSAGALFERIVCGVDRSLESHRALGYALSLSHRHLAVVHALEGFSEEDPRFRGHFNTVECWRKAGPEIQADYEELIPEEARLWCAIEVVVPFGRAGGVLIEEAEARQASLVVIGAAGRHSPFGTTARHVIQEARCPVLAVPRAGPPAERWSRMPTAATAARPGAQ
jgi:nucleotide-binding universal stress UspA family protein